jgi:hypothetical protein
VDHAYGDAPRPVNRVPETVTEWMDGEPRLGVDCNDLPIILHIPGWQKDKALVSNFTPHLAPVLIVQKEIFNEICRRFSETMPPTRGDSADKKWRNREDSYRERDGEACGRIRLVSAWHPIGHPVSSRSYLPLHRKLIFEQKSVPVPSSNLLASGKKFGASAKALSELSVSAQRLNNVLEQVDPGAAAQYSELRKRAENSLPYLRCLNSEDPSLWQGRMFHFNLLAPPHYDTRNPAAEWTPLHAAGDFSRGGCLFVHNLNLRLRYLPGDLIFFRGRLLKHSVEEWGAGQRISVVYFTHETLWKYFNCRLTV